MCLYFRNDSVNGDVLSKYKDMYRASLSVKTKENSFTKLSKDILAICKDIGDVLL